MSDARAIPVSLFALLRDELGATVDVIRCTKATLVHISHTLEDMVLHNQLAAIIFTGFQESSHWREETERYRALVNIAQQVCIFAGAPLPPESAASELRITLSGDDPLRQEWFLGILSDRFAVILCGQDQQSSVEEEALREFDTIWSFEPAVVDRVMGLLENVVAHYRPERLPQLQEARAQTACVPLMR
ncbi:MAG: anti-anti-sigma factor, partial [Spirulinaceae cyanobacterium RM2_2_10]|nr:anti-anti-sigma factor [Spirulinaceae cyanobacterium RM2_2_10]